MPLYFPSTPPAAIGVKGCASPTQAAVPIGTAFFIDWLGVDQFNSGGLHPAPNEFMTDRDGLWLFDVSVQFKPMPSGAIDYMVLQLEAGGQILNDSNINSDYLHFPSLTYKMPAGMRVHVIGLLQSTANQVVIDPGWRTYFSMTYLGPTPPTATLGEGEPEAPPTITRPKKRRGA